MLSKLRTNCEVFVKEKIGRNCGAVPAIVNVIQRLRRLP